MTAQHNPLRDLVAAHKTGELVGITSVCSANPIVLETSIRYAARHQTLLCVEATCNQVNQFGGYTGMHSDDFTRFVHQMAKKEGLPEGQLILGGDHLGPHPWKEESAKNAMQKAKQMVAEYVQAGFSKIHLDASMRLGDDSDEPLDVSTIASRAAQLCAVAESVAEELGRTENLVYIIGTEVPIPGGIQGNAQGIYISTVDDTVETLRLTRQAFEALGLTGAWERVIALVVHPGVEFENYHVSPYDPHQTEALSKYIESQPQLIYEAHSTDYQTVEALQQMVKDHFAILKVGPELTFAFREAVFALENVEKEILIGRSEKRLSNLSQIVDGEMQAKPEYWTSYYSGNKHEQALARKFSFSDRIRYYWPSPQVQKALERLLTNLANVEIPISLLSQYVPQEYHKIREGKLTPVPQELIRAHIEIVLSKYWKAIHMVKA